MSTRVHGGERCSRISRWSARESTPHSPQRSCRSTSAGTYPQPSAQQPNNTHTRTHEEPGLGRVSFFFLGLTCLYFSAGGQATDGRGYLFSNFQSHPCAEKNVPVSPSSPCSRLLRTCVQARRNVKGAREQKILSPLENISISLQLCYLLCSPRMYYRQVLRCRCPKTRSCSETRPEMLLDTVHI